MVLFYNLMTVIPEEIIHRHSNVWPRLHPDCARVLVTSVAIETSMAEKIWWGGGWGGGGVGCVYHFIDLFSVNIHITGDSISSGMGKYDPQLRKRYTVVNPKPS